MSTMTFDEAVELARLIRERDGWYVLNISPSSGEKLDDDHWSVMAVSRLHWSYFHYWNQAGAAAEWPQYVEAAEQGMRTRASSHEQ